MFKINEYVYPKVLPWQAILQDIFDEGCRKSDLAELLGVPIASLWRWIEGTEPKESIGTSILVIHTRYCGEQRTEIRKAQAIPCKK